MTLAELKSAVDLLPAGSSLTLSRDDLAAALCDVRPEKVPPSQKPDRLIGAKEVATLMGVSTRYVYAYRHNFPFAKKLPSGAIRFSEAGLQRWMAR